MVKICYLKSTADNTPDFPNINNKISTGFNKRNSCPSESQEYSLPPHISDNNDNSTGLKLSAKDKRAKFSHRFSSNTNNSLANNNINNGYCKNQIEI